MAQINQSSKGGGQRTRDHHSQVVKGSFDVEGTLDPRSICITSSSKWEAAGLRAAGGRSAQGVVMTEIDDCGASFITNRQTSGRFAPAWEPHSGKANAKMRSESLVYSQATRTGMGRGRSMTSGRQNTGHGYRTEIRFMMRSFRNGQYRTERKRHQQRLLTIRAHLPL